MTTRKRWFAARPAPETWRTIGGKLPLVVSTVVCACVLALVLLASSSSAHAEDDSMLASPHTEESWVILGTKSLASLQSLESADRTAAFGVALFGEVTLLKDRLEAELGVSLSSTVEGLDIAVEPLFKLPLAGTQRFDPYLALGPFLLKAQRPPLTYGGQLAAGGYLWLRESFGLDFDLSLVLLYDHGPGLELALGAGPVLRI